MALVTKNHLMTSLVLCLGDSMGIFDFFGKKETPEERMKREEQERKKEAELKKYQNQPMKITIQEVYNIAGVGAVPTGTIETGIARIGQKVTVKPSGATGTIKTMEAEHQMIKEAPPGTKIGFTITGVGKDQIEKGSTVISVGNPND